MTLKDDLRRVAVLRAVRDRLGTELDEATATLTKRLRAAKKRTGSRLYDALLPSGQQIASVTWVDPAPAPAVTDADALTAWVQANHPEQVTTRTVVEVRPAYLKLLLAEMKASGLPQAADPETGELVAVPGVEFTVRTAHPRLTFTDGGRELAAEAWRSGQLGGLLDLAPDPGTPGAAA